MIKKSFSKIIQGLILLLAISISSCSSFPKQADAESVLIIKVDYMTSDGNIFKDTSFYVNFDNEKENVHLYPGINIIPIKKSGIRLISGFYALVSNSNKFYVRDRPNISINIEPGMINIYNYIARYKVQEEPKLHFRMLFEQALMTTDAIETIKSDLKNRDNFDLWKEFKVITNLK